MAAKANRKPTGRAPISAHPVFPAIVALWFAALFGIGSLVLPGVLFDKAAGLVGLGAVGMGGRIAIALGAAALGALLGVVLARKVAAAHTPNPVRARRVAPAETDVKRPISALEELGPEGLDQPLAENSGHGFDEPERPAPEPIPGRRRALSVTDESGPSEFLDRVPLPGKDEDTGEDEPQAMAEPEDDSEEADDMLELGDFEEEHDNERAVPQTRFGSGSLSAPLEGGLAGRDRPDISRRYDADAANARPFDAPEFDASPHPAGTGEPAPFAPAPFAPPPETGGVRRPFDPVDDFVDEDETIAPEEPFELPNRAPSPFAELRREFETHEEREEVVSAAFQAHTPDDAAEPETAPFAPPAPEPEPQQATHLRSAFGMPEPVSEPAHPFAEEAAYAQPAPEPELAAVEPEPQAPGGVAAAALADLGMVELVERFALSLQGHAARNAQTSEPFPETAASPPPTPIVSQPVPAPEPEPEQPHPAEAPSIPTALQPIGYGEEDDEDLDEMPSLSLPLDRSGAQFGKPAEEPAESENVVSTIDADLDAEDEAELQPDGQRFGSLLAMKSPFGGGREFVRIEDDVDAEVDGVEPVVVFPGNEMRRSAFPASDGPSRDPGEIAQFGRQPHRVDRGGTEQALREALAKLQKMSGAA